MKFLKFVLPLFLASFLMAGENVMNMYNPDGTLHFNYKAEDLEPSEKAARENLEKDLAKIVALPKEKRTFENTLLAYDEAFDKYSKSLGQAGFLAYVSTDEKLRNAALALEEKISNYMVEVATRKDIYQAFKDYADTNPNLPKIEAKMLKDAMIGFRKSGLMLDDKNLEIFKDLQKKKSKNAIEFSKNIREYKDNLAVSKEELSGLGQDYISRLEKDENGKYIITLNYPDYVPFMLNADEDNARKQLEEKYSKRGGTQNISLLEDNLFLRYQTAKLLGYKTHAHNRLDTRMAKTPENVMNFLQDLEKKLKPLAKKEQKELLKYKTEKTGQKTKKIETWQSGYWSNKYKKEHYDIDAEKIKEFFPTNYVIENMLEIFGDLFDVKFQKANIDTWHKDVVAYKVFDNEKSQTIAYVYMDLYPRDGKYKHAACFDLVAGKELKDGTYQKPFTAIVANLNPPSKDSPSLLKHDEVETLFHEFGHVLHNVLTEAKYSSISGTATSMDFVEVPSQMLENWVWQPEVLKKISKHYKTGEPLSDETINKMIAAKHYSTGSFYLRQNFLAQIDMRYHLAKKKIDSTDYWSRYSKKIRGVPLRKGAYPQASFDHIMGGYDAGYYGYLWAEVIAQDFFSEFEKHGIFNKDIGKKYRKEILAVGGSYEEEELVKNFLGRKVSNEPFLKGIGF